MHFWYKFFTYLFFPFSPIYLFFRKIRKKEHPERYKEKMSLIKIQREKGFLIWFHVASVGEAMSILPLIECFEKEKKIDKILITTITLSSAKVLNKKFFNKEKIIHQFLPLDIPNFVNKFLNHWSPNISIFIDSEIWPNLILKIKEKNIPLILLNGRITKKSFHRWNLLKNFAREVFGKIDLCLASNSESENYLKILGSKNIKNYGNLKFAKSETEPDLNNNTDFISKIKNRKIWCAASTHPTEEIFCAKTHSIIKKKYNNILTIIIPRHINRSEKIFKELTKRNFKVLLHNEIEKINDDTDILLVNSYGEALKFYRTSKCVFLGKSLIENLKNDSGQNPIEPARLGCTVFHGPNTSNFDDIYKFLNSLGISYKINSPEELGQSIIEEFKKNKEKNEEIIKKIENYGLNTLNNVLREIKIYINT
tara:strand:+ start:159 stop:1430 length:1272 start_codon:yes stop_codon:yes gene_type:complete